MSRIYVALDLETTGLNPERDAIIEIGAVKFRGDQVLDTWSSLVNPQRPIPFKIQQLTGITSQEAAAAPSLFSLLKPLRRFVGRHPIVGHNIPFDLRFLRRQGLFQENQQVDTFELASILLPHAARYSLGKLAEALGVSYPTQHRALDDALATHRLFLALLDQARQLPMEVIQEIANLSKGIPWPLGEVFRDLAREMAHTAFTSSIGQQLRAKGALDGQGSLGLLFGRKEEEPPLRPRERRIPLDVDALTAMLEEGGAFARSFPGYEYRPQQVEMLRAVARAFNESQHLLVEAGTGVGKSMAYLIPAAHWAVQNGEHVVISTNTINLQEQLFRKDIPDLQRFLPFEVRAALLKGRSNYLCLRRLDALRHRRDLSPAEMLLLAKILVWLPSTVTGDRTELFLPTAREQSLWSLVSADAEICIAERCRYRQEDRCFFYRARRQAEQAHLIVVNHALLLSDVAVENRVLPEYRYLIVDEAHHLEAATTRQLSFSADLAHIQRLLNSISQAVDTRHYTGLLNEILSRCRRLPQEHFQKLLSHVRPLQRLTERAGRSLYEFFALLEDFLQEHKKGNPAYDQRIRLTGALRIQPAWSNVEIAWDNVSAQLTRLVQGLVQLGNGLTELEQYNIPDLDDLLQDLLARTHLLQEMLEQLNVIIADPPASAITWAEISARDGRLSLHAAPLHVGALVERHLFLPKESVILTSATLCTNGDFSYIRQRLNAWDAQELCVGSPFDYQSSTLLYLPIDIPEPNRPGYQEAIAQALISLCRAIQGRTLVLFTSYSQLNNAAKAITIPLAEEGITVLQQGDGSSRAHLLESFRTLDKAVLLGTRSFWEGIDIVGPALSCLVITRLPFSVPTDPIFAARSEGFEDPFNEYSVPETILRFRQGFGRLIRSCTDRGVVVVLDKRVLTKSYGRAFLNSLPECTVRRGSVADLPRAAVQWIDGGE